MPGEDAADETELRRGCSGEGWMDEIPARGLVSSSDHLAPHLQETRIMCKTGL